MSFNDWISPDSFTKIPSPGLLVDEDLVVANIDRMIEMVGGPQQAHRLRPHVKTHKMPNVIQLQLNAKITQFKVATLAEAQMVAHSGATDVLIAYPMVGPNIAQLLALTKQYTKTSFAAVVDHPDGCSQLAEQFKDPANRMRTFIDIDCGMHRTGVSLGPEVARLKRQLKTCDGLEFSGLHLYDGHLHQPSLAERREAVIAIIESVESFDRESAPRTMVAGGSPTFAFWASESEYQCSPGTTVFWDVGYADAYPDLRFQVAAALLTRVVSKPTEDRLCLDLGYKSIASEMPLDRRVRFPEIPDAVPVAHSEEHLVIETSRATEFQIGRPLLALPTHICPTVALHAFATVFQSGKPTDRRWRVTARDRN